MTPFAGGPGYDTTATSVGVFALATPSFNARRRKKLTRPPTPIAFLTLRTEKIWHTPRLWSRKLHAGILSSQCPCHIRLRRIIPTMATPIPKGSIILPALWRMCHDPKVYKDYKDSPERYLEPRNEPGPGAVVFGHGRRVFPSHHLAESSLFVHMAQTLSAFNISRAANGNETHPCQGGNADCLDPIAA